jgi:hypothetical protein
LFEAGCQGLTSLEDDVLRNIVGPKRDIPSWRSTLVHGREIKENCLMNLSFKDESHVLRSRSQLMEPVYHQYGNFLLLTQHEKQ